MKASNMILGSRILIDGRVEKMELCDVVHSKGKAFVLIGEGASLMISQSKSSASFCEVVL